MKFLRFYAGGQARHGYLVGEEVVELAAGYFDGAKKSGRKHRLNSIKLLAPCIPTKIIAVGLNYADHAREMNLTPPSEPVIFIKPSSSVIGPEDLIIYPKVSRRVDYEAELACVVKKQMRRVPRQQVADNLLGYTCFNDVTARDLQSADVQWTRSKSFDTFSPVGPYIVNDIDPNNLRIELYQNGVRKQSSHTSQFIYKIDEVVSFISGVMTLYPGDVITTGTPMGIGPMRAGDRVEVVIEKIGTLRNYVRREN